MAAEFVNKIIHSKEDLEDFIKYIEANELYLICKEMLNCNNKHFSFPLYGLEQKIEELADKYTVDPDRTAMIGLLNYLSNLNIDAEISFTRMCINVNYFRNKFLVMPEWMNFMIKYKEILIDENGITYFALKFKNHSDVVVNQNDLSKLINLINKYELFTLAPIMLKNKGFFSIIDENTTDTVGGQVTMYHMINPTYNQITLDNFLGDLINEIDIYGCFRIIIACFCNHGINKEFNKNTDNWKFLEQKIEKLCTQLT